METKGKRRALRRHHSDRVRRKAEKVVKGWEVGEDNTRRLTGRLKDNLKSCSCAMCGNPRRHEKGDRNRKTLQERKAELDGLYDEEVWGGV